MNIESFREYCLSFKEVKEEFPFDKDTLVFKVRGKMFALTDVESFNYINLKCKPEMAVELRELYTEVQPGFHMNKKHWNTISTEGSLPDSLICEWIKKSYELVVAGLPEKDRANLV